MTLQKVIDIFKDVMYMEKDDEVDVNKSLFTHYEMSSIDLIDFTFELKKTFALTIEPEDIWPINKMISTSELYDAESKKWTQSGIHQLKELLSHNKKTENLKPDTDVRNLYAFFTIEYVANKIEKLTDIEEVE
ncbi:acyl carrier protein [Enterobacter asburiae]|uniref:acyl carrier protein n=1 Tax=Enterobacter asburiae TaxID=61645 RepID=UPI0011D1D69D|nr:acyl carrier protein [Enterobacter asburiae]